MNNRFQTIARPDGTVWREGLREYAVIEKLDKRSPVFNYYKYRFVVFGYKAGMEYEKWLRDTFGPSKWYGHIKRNIKAGLTSFDDAPWLIHNADQSGWQNTTYFYFNENCRPLIMLKFGVHSG